MPWKIIVGLLGGLAFGAIWPSLGLNLKFFGTFFIQCIQMVVIPLIFSSVTLGVWKLGADLRRLARVIGVAFVWFLIAGFVAIVIGIGLDAIFRPGLGVNLVNSGSIPQGLSVKMDWFRFVLDLIPSNVIAAMASQHVLPTVIFAMLLGLALASIGERSKALMHSLEGLMEAMFVITRWIVALTPIAVFGIMAWLAASQGRTTLLALGKLVATLYLGFFLLWCFFWIVLACFRMNPRKITRGVAAPMLLGFTTRSSEATLPLMMETLLRLGVSQRVVSVVLPLGYSFNLDGAALYQSLAALFLVDIYGIHITATLVITIVATTLVASKGLANVPSASLVALATVTHAIGLPVEALALITGVDVFMDMGRTATNVYGNAVAAFLVQKLGDVASPEHDVIPASLASLDRESGELQPRNVLRDGHA
ncbi:dicarboxylate/amino acid:cation symporter [uncultured Caballeronia sp.]|uniref:dicarboxylate/amino acid:cation symporter n=1 Tax=uncultured Caballeronia sp. TaxID=1827198 RepID=UPI0035C9D1C2